MKSIKKTCLIPTNLNNLITALSSSPKTKFSKLIKSLRLKIGDFESYANWSRKGYVRNCIVENEHFELILICWSAGQKTPIHDHGGEECWVKVIDGKLKETIYRNDENDELVAISTSVKQINQVSYMKDFMGFHRLENNSNTRSMSLHLYAKPILKCNVFDEKLKTFVCKDMIYHTIPSY